MSLVHKMISGVVSDIQRFSIHDGPGIRTTVFLKGCPLSCLWCHNPETISQRRQIAFYANKCIGCGQCADICKNEAITAGDERINREKCAVCGKCTGSCPPEALELIGQDMTVEEVLETVLRDAPFYKNSGGGITLSGGEPLYQHEFSISLLKAAKNEGLHTAVETCGLVKSEIIKESSVYTDLFLYDVKIIDHEKHRKYCGIDNTLILQNARFIVSLGKSILFRTPIVPGYNDSTEDIKRLGDFILSLPGNQQLQLMSYHSIGCGKYKAIGLNYLLADVKAPESMDKYYKQLSDMGVDVIQR